ncbi:MAG: tail fiber domain-containing protein, partial [Candidatus Delongbacteria bacterium]|nr:tail fiber domain-containing protein [Candidatus Delongbacteria bacterium]
TTEAKINLDNSKDRGLSRSFSVTTSASKGTNALEVTATDAHMHSLDVTGENATMSSTAKGPRFSYFSPDNIFLGENAGIATVPGSTAGKDNVFIGNNAGVTNNTGYKNVFLGMEAGRYNYSGGSNIFLGYQTGQNNTASSNLFIGNYAGKYNASGYLNSYLGHTAGRDQTTGYYNSYFGYGTGYAKSGGNENTLLGAFAGATNLSGAGNVFLGYSAGYYETGSDKLYIDNSSTSTPLIYGDFDSDYVRINGFLNVNGLSIANLGNNKLGLNGDIVPYLGSSAGYDLGNNLANEYWDDIVGDDFINYSKFGSKSDIKNIDSGVEKIMKLRPITYKSDRKKFGLIPDEVQNIMPEAVVSEDIDIDPETGKLIVTEVEKGVVYNQFIPVLIKSIQEQQVEISELKLLNDKLLEKMNELEKIVENMKIQNK